MTQVLRRQDETSTTNGTSQDKLAGIPPVQAAVLRPVTERIIKEIIQEVRENVPAYSHPLEGAFGKTFVACVEKAVLQVTEGIGNPSADRSGWEQWFRHVGRVEYTEGRTMDSLQTAVRIGTQVAWRHIRAAGSAVGTPTGVLFAFADALFLYADELSAVAIAGYAEAQRRATGAAERRRQRLLKMLVSDPPVSPQAIVDQAEASAWTVPARVAAVAIERRDDQHQLPAFRLDRQVLVDLDSSAPCLLAADPERHLSGLRRGLAGRRAAIGPLVRLEQAAKSLACARRTLDLAQAGVLATDDGIIRCAQHLPTLAISADGFVLGQLTEHALGPFTELTAKQREKLSETLLAWLCARGGITEVADHLGVHPQTVRYRMNQAKNLLGGRLEDPDERFALEIALRATRLRRSQ